jgi:hypothetical protein
VPFQQAPISSSTWVIMMSRMSQQHVKKSYEPLQNTTTRRAAHHSGLAYTQFWGAVAPASESNDSSTLRLPWSPREAVHPTDQPML